MPIGKIAKILHKLEDCWRSNHHQKKKIPFWLRSSYRGKVRLL